MPQLLFLGPRDALDNSRRILLKRAGYKVSAIQDSEEAIASESWAGCALVILAGKIAAPHRRTLLSKLKTAKVAVLDLANPGEFKRSRLADSGPESFLEMVGRATMAAHGHPEITGKNVAWVDRDRRYVHVTDGFLQLIGYDRDEVIGHLIDEFTYPGTADTHEVFHRYLSKGRMSGRFALRHKSGAKVPIRYRAAILPDGCMYSNIQPAKQQSPSQSRGRSGRSMCA